MAQKERKTRNAYTHECEGRRTVATGGAESASRITRSRATRWPSRAVLALARGATYHSAAAEALPTDKTNPLMATVKIGTLLIRVRSLISTITA